jgi:hypothetical protein
MTTDFDRSSATIYQFPPRGRYALGAGQLAAERGSMMDLALPRMTSPTLGGSWYHEEAIREERARQE